jgi:hypothetical protein
MAEGLETTTSLTPTEEDGCGVLLGLLGQEMVGSLSGGGVLLASPLAEEMGS